MRLIRTAPAALFSMLALLTLSPARAQPGGEAKQPDMSLTADMRAEVIEGALKKLESAYVFPDVAKKMAEGIRSRLEKKEYDNITSAKQLATTLTDQLQAISHDKHLRVRYSHEPIPKRLRGEPGPEEKARFRRDVAANNFGFEKVERLEGNVGYLELRGFLPADMAGETAASAMAFLAHTDTLIIDLRKNGGGSPGMVALMCSYLLPAEEVVHLNDLYFRPENSTHQWWTLPYVPGKRYEGKKVYLLTSKRTFSAAEEFTYNLKNLHRATIVGETTGGGAHPGGPRPINDHFSVWVPTGRAINPVSKTNWEGTGVKPDIEVSADLALQTAYLDALKKLAEKKKDEPMAGKQFKELIERAQKELDERKAGNKQTALANPR